MFGTMNKIWRSNNITTATKMKLYGTFVIPVVMYEPECWYLRKEDERRILVAEMNWLQRILGSPEETGYEMRLPERNWDKRLH